MLGKLEMDRVWIGEDPWIHNNGEYGFSNELISILKLKGIITPVDASIGVNGYFWKQARKVNLEGQLEK